MHIYLWKKKLDLKKNSLNLFSMLKNNKKYQIFILMRNV